VVPDADDREFINSVIFDEISMGVNKPSSKARIQKIIKKLKKEQGIQGVILGCTELPILIHQEDVDIPVFDTTRIHAMAAADFALNRTTLSAS
jgi:aspartate racemase